MSFFISFIRTKQKYNTAEHLFQHFIQLNVEYSHLFITFAMIRSGSCNQYYYEKVLLKLSSVVNSRKILNGTKLIAVAPHHSFVQPMLASYISFGVGCYCFIRTKANARSLPWDKTNIVPTPFLFIRFHLGISQHEKIFQS